MNKGKVLAVAFMAFAAGCGVEYIDDYSCDHPDKGHKDANGQPDPCHLNDPDGGDAGDASDGGDAGDAKPPGETCDGQCVPAIPDQWFGPSFVWMGAEADAPPCPERAPVEGYDGHGDLSAVASLCGACECAPPTGSCGLPATVTAASTTLTCPPVGVGVTLTSSDPPAGWDGSCTANEPSVAGALCNGVPCVQSIIIAPLTMTESGCTPIEPTSAPALPTWQSFARTCVFGPAPLCQQPGRVCVPPVTEPGFNVCISQRGDPSKPALDCPASYPSRSVFYDELIDDHTCSPCACDAPVGGTCSGSISIFEDSTCDAQPVVSLKIKASTSAPCVDVPPGSALGSKSASEPVYTRGTCAPSGGVQNGGAVPDGATVFCCRETL